VSLLLIRRLLPWLRRWWPPAVGLLLLALLWWRIAVAIDDAHERGGMAERSRWQQAAARAAEDATRIAAARQENADRADVLAAQKIEQLNAVEGDYVEKVRILYRDRVDAGCIDADGMRLVRAADAARAAAATAGGGAGFLPQAGTGGQPARQ